MNFNKVNNITGWAVGLFACAVYILTAEAGGSLWDCGEFVSSCYKLQVPHPPGAPLFVILGRVFIVLFGDNPLTAAKAVNVMSALSSGFTILFLFWTITHFARKIVLVKNKTIDASQMIAIMGAGVVGALAYTFSDSFWYSAVEGEVYAMSSFFTALVFWAILKWEHAVDHEETIGYNPDRWIVFIFFMMGLSIGVHLLSLLTIPAIVMVYYYKKYSTTKWGTLWAFLIGCVVTGVVQKVVIQYSINGAGYFDIFFVNNLGLPFFSGFIVFFILLAALLFYGIKVAKKKNWGFLRLGLWCVAFILIGYSSYLTTMIRSNANPSIDMYNVDNPMSLVGYLGREQYGDFPLLHGQTFTAQPVDYKETSTKYQKGNGKYDIIGKDGHYVYDAADQMFFPRVWDASNDQGHADYYAQYLGIQKMQDGSYDRTPTQVDNVKFFMGYQFYYMYFRYFMWNFSGKQNDVQGIFTGNVRDGNWITGISFIDNAMYGDQSLMPDSSKQNKANNKLFMLPFILGIIGLLYHYKVNQKDAFVNMLMFFFTGMAIVLYLNQAGNQPRERDYAYVGSFYAFAVWIGLGVLQVKDWVTKYVSSSVATNVSVAVCLLAVPVLMGSQEWDDHDRSNKTIARDLAKNYLESCPENAVLFSFGDNDTYPLWYAQEVEGIRKDVRVINYSLLGIDWYINQLRNKVNNSNAIDVIWTAAQIQGRNRDYVRYKELAGIPQSQYFDLYDLMKNYVGSDDQNKMMAAGGGDMINTYPVKRVSIPVDQNLVKQNGTIMNSDSAVLNEVRFEIPKNILLKNDLAVLNILAANKWSRPICFTSLFDELGFGKNLRREGMIYKFVPIENAELNEEVSYKKLKNDFVFGNAQKPRVYYDEENRRHLNSIRGAYAETAFALAMSNKKEQAREILNRCDSLMNKSNFPYGQISRGNLHDRNSIAFLESCYRADAKELAAKVLQSVRKDLQQQLKFYNSLSGKKSEWMDYEKQTTESYLTSLDRIEAVYNPKPVTTPNKPDSSK